MDPVVFLSVQDPWDGFRDLPCHVLEGELLLPYLQLPALLIWLAQIIALVAIFAVYLLC